MALTVATNTGALMAQAAASSVNKDMETAMERLSTGKRINGASDDAAGVAISSRLTAEIKGTNQAIRNAMDAQSLIDTAEGGHIEVEAIMQRMRELAVQASNGSNDASDRANLQIEVDQLTTEIDRIAQTTSWAGQSLLNGTSSTIATATDGGKDLTFQVGSGTSAADTLSVSINALSAGALGLNTASSKPTVAVASVTDADADTTGKLALAGNKISFSGDWKAGDKYSFDVQNVAQVITLVDADAYSNDAAGVSAQIKAEIDALITAGTYANNLSTIDDGAGSVTVNATAIQFSEAVVTTDATTHATFNTHVVTDAGNATVITDTLSNGDTVIQFGGTWEAGDKFKVKIAGQGGTTAASIEITLTGGADNFTDDLEGVAKQMKAALDASSDTTLEDLRFETDGAGKLTIIDDRRHAFSVSSDGATLSLSGTKHEDGEVFDFKIGGIAVTTVTTADDDYADNAAGVAMQIRDAIKAEAGLTHLNVTSDANGNITISNPTAVVLDDYAKTVGDQPITTMLATTAAGGKITFGGTSEFIDGTVYKAMVNGNEVAITANATDGYANDKDGLAKQMLEAVEASGAVTGLATMALGAADSGEIVFTEATNMITNSKIVLDSNGGDNTAAISVNGTVITLANYSVTDKFSFEVLGQTVNFEYSQAAGTAGDDGFENDTAGVGAQLAAAVDALGITGLKATGAADKVTLSWDDAEAFGEMYVEPTKPGVAYADGKMSITGNIGSGDNMSFSVDGKDFIVQAFNSSKSDTAGLLKQAIDAGKIDGLTVTDNGDGTLSMIKAGGNVTVTDISAAAKTIETIDAALLTLNNQRANLGALTNRLDSTVNNLTNMSTNLQAGRGRIEDADFAAETTSLAKSQILQQASTAMLAQANASKQNVLSLLQG